MKGTSSSSSAEEKITTLMGIMSNGGGGGRSASEKEKTKMRERQRRAITTKIFNGLRKHGGYNLPPRADINDVLRELAREAGWIVEPDGTTYRINHPSFSTTTSLLGTSSSSQHHHQYYPQEQQQQHFHNCVTCINASTGGKSSGTPTPTSSLVGGGGGDCSTTASPHRSAAGGGGVSSLNNQTHHQILSPSTENAGIPNSLYFGMLNTNYYSPINGGINMGIGQNNSVNSIMTINGGQNTTTIADHQMSMVMPPLSNIQQLLYFQQEEEARASNQNTPIASPQRFPASSS